MDQSKRELLVKQVVDLVVHFVNTEGGITLADLEQMFGPASDYHDVPAALGKTFLSGLIGKSA